jgi:hypothetical protein
MADIPLDMFPVPAPRAPSEPAATRLGVADGRIAVRDLSPEHQCRPVAKPGIGALLETVGDG